MIDEIPLIDQVTFRQVLASFPTGVTVITAVDRDGVLRGFTCNALTSVSAEPPLLAVCVGQQSETLPALLDTGRFVVNILAKHQEAISRRFAGKSAQKFRGIEWHPSEAARGAPVLADVAAHAECRVIQTLEVGDHWMFIAEIMQGDYHNETDPLVYCRRSYGSHEPGRIYDR